MARTRRAESGELSDADAIRLAQKGDAAAFEQLYRLHSRRVYALCLRMVGNTAEAEDPAQEAFLQLFRKIHTFRGESAFSTVISVASWHEFQDSDTLGGALEVAAARIPQDRVRVCLIGDGASWVWTEMVRSFPNAKQILDFYHCFEHLHTVARSQWGEGEGAWEGRHWAERNMIRLCEGDKACVIAGLRRMEPRTEDTKEEVRKLIVYLENHSEQINYFQDLEDGYPIGSGAMETANNFICHTRMKRSGAWWVIDTGNDKLRIRCAIHNGTFDRVFQHHMESTASSTRRRKTRRVHNE